MIIDNLTDIDMKQYKYFREEIDECCFPLLKKWAERTGCYKPIMYEGEQVGFLMVIEEYINGIYVLPDFRRKGLARKAVVDYVKAGNIVEELHIVNSNKTAFEFWNSIFDIRPIERNECDTLYRIVGLKGSDQE